MMYLIKSPIRKMTCLFAFSFMMVTPAHAKREIIVRDLMKLATWHSDRRSGIMGNGNDWLSSKYPSIFIKKDMAHTNDVFVTGKKCKLVKDTERFDEKSTKSVIISIFYDTSRPGTLEVGDRYGLTHPDDNSTWAEPLNEEYGGASPNKNQINRKRVRMIFRNRGNYPSVLILTCEPSAEFPNARDLTLKQVEEDLGNVIRVLPGWGLTWKLNRNKL